MALARLRPLHPTESRKLFLPAGFSSRSLRVFLSHALQLRLAEPEKPKRSGAGCLARLEGCELGWARGRGVAARQQRPGLRF